MLRASTAVSRRPLEDASSAEPRNAKVLIIEVDESARSVLEAQLKKDHFDVICARSGGEVHRLLGAGRELPDVVVLATRLGNEDGYSLCAELRGDRRTSALPVVLLANAGEDNPQALADVVGVSQCLARPLYVRDVSIHVRLAIAPRDESGAVVLYCEDTSPAQVLRAVLSSNQTGRLELLGGRGVIEFSDGRVLDATVDGNSGGDAMVRALVLSAGQYTLRTGVAVGGPVLQFSLRDLVSTVFPRIARWERLLLRSVPLEALLQVDFAQLAAALPELPDAVNGVVRLFDARRDVRRVLLDSPLHETITLEVVTRLYLMGVLVPAAHALTDDEAAPAAPVRLFEPRDNEADERMQSLFGPGVPDPQLLPADGERVAEPN
jgi:DNA-binding response OmpR family regulator